MSAFLEAEIRAVLNAGECADWLRFPFTHKRIKLLNPPCLNERLQQRACSEDAKLSRRLGQAGSVDQFHSQFSASNKDRNHG